MAKVGIPPEQREAVLAVTAAVLHLGNVAFVEGRDADSSMVKPGGLAEESLAAAGEHRVGWLRVSEGGRCALLQRRPEWRRRQVFESSGSSGGGSGIRAAVTVVVAAAGQRHQSSSDGGGGGRAAALGQQQRRRGL
jgi:hypothetical protein